MKTKNKKPVRKMVSGGIVNNYSPSNPYANSSITDTGAFQGITAGLSLIPGVGGLIGKGASILGSLGAFDFIGAGKRDKQAKMWESQQAADLKKKQEEARIGLDMNRAMSQVSTQPTALYARGTDNVMNANISKNTMKINAKTKRVGDGIELSAFKKGKDTIPANINGQQLLLDDGEVVIPYGDKTAVISEDNGGVNQYKKDLRLGKPNATEKAIARAGMLKNKNTKKLVWGTDQIQSARDYINTAQYASGYNSIAGNKASNLSKSFSKDNINTALDIGGVALTAIQNAKAMKQLKNVKYPEFVQTPYAGMDIDVNKSVFDNARSQTLSQQSQLNKRIMENTANSGTALANVAVNKAATLENLGKIGSEQIANRGQIANINVQGANQYAQQTSLMRQAQEQGQYQDQINRINTQLGLNKSLQDTIQGVRQVGMVKDYQKEQLEILKNTYGVTGNTPAEMKQDAIARLKRRLVGLDPSDPSAIEIQKDLDTVSKL